MPPYEQRAPNTTTIVVDRSMYNDGAKLFQAFFTDSPETGCRLMAGIASVLDPPDALWYCLPNIVVTAPVEEQREDLEADTR